MLASRQLVNRVFVGLGLGLFLGSVAVAQPTKAWVKFYPGPAGFRDLVWDITVDNAGNSYVTGESDHGTGSSYATVKFDPNGNQLWVARYDGPAHGSDKAFMVVLDQDGNVIITGVSDGIGSFGDYATVKYDGQTGAQLWATRYNGGGNNLDGALALDLDTQGNVYVTGQSWGGDNSFYDIATVKYDGQTGAELWAVRYDGPWSSSIPEHEHASDAGISIAVDNQGGAAVTGWAQVYYDENEEFNIYNYVTVKYDTDGNQIWDAFYDEQLGFGSQGVAVRIDGNDDVFVTGTSQGVWGTLKYSGANGSVLWEARYDGPVGSSTAYAMTLDSADNVIVIGSTCASSPFCNESFATVKYDGQSGAVLWEQIHTEGGSSIGSSARGVTVDFNDNVYVTGFKATMSKTEALTIKYNRDGVERWIDRYDTPDNLGSVGTALAADSRGNLLLGGQARHAASFWDYLIIKYKGPAFGDMNCDGVLDFFDIDPFILALNDPTAYGNAYPGCDIQNADVNEDGVIDFFDIDPFVALLIS